LIVLAGLFSLARRFRRFLPGCPHSPRFPQKNTNTRREALLLFFLRDNKLLKLLRRLQAARAVACSGHKTRDSDL